MDRLLNIEWLTLVVLLLPVAEFFHFCTDFDFHGHVDFNKWILSPINRIRDLYIPQLL